MSDSSDEGGEEAPLYPPLPEEVQKKMDWVLRDLDSESDDMLEPAGLQLRDVVRDAPQHMFVRVPELIKVLLRRSLIEGGPLFREKGPTTSHIWVCLRIVQALKDLSGAFPSMGETYFVDIYGVLEGMSKLRANDEDLPWQTLVVSLISLW